MDGTTIEKLKLIAVEGKDEINFFNAILHKLNIPDIQILDFKGKTNFSSRIKSISNIPGFNKVTSFALIRDSDNLPPQSAFDSIRHALRTVGLPVPTIINTFTDTNPSIGIYIMPGNSQNGMLEDLCLNSINDYPINNCIDAFINCSVEKPSNESKSRVLCYLATKNPLVNSLGLGALNGHWDLNSQVFNDINEFLEFMR
jgi:hypothetical protein